MHELTKKQTNKKTVNPKLELTQNWNEQILFQMQVPVILLLIYHLNQGIFQCLVEALCQLIRLGMICTCNPVFNTRSCFSFAPVCTVTLTNRWNVRKINCRNNCCRGRTMAARSEGLDYFALGRLVDFLCSSCLSLKMDYQRFVLLLVFSEIAQCAQNGSFRLSFAA